jgi:hypothetical protein
MPASRRRFLCRATLKSKAPKVTSGCMGSSLAATDPGPSQSRKEEGLNPQRPGLEAKGVGAPVEHGTGRTVPGTVTASIVSYYQFNRIQE